MARTGGRQLGTPNKVTAVFKDAVRIVYDEIGGHAAFAVWARENPTEFYKIAARLIPTEIAARGESITVIVNRSGAVIDQADYVEVGTQPAGDTRRLLT